MSDPTNLRVLGVSNGAAAVALDSDQVQPGHYLEVFAVSLANGSGESVTAVFSLVTGAESDQLLPKATVAAGDATASTGRWYLGEGQKLRCTVTGTALAGPQSFVLMARHYDLEEDIAAPGAEVPSIGH